MSDLKKIKLGNLGDLEVSADNLAAVLDIVMEWGDSPSRAHVSRLCAAAIGVTVKGAKCPRYSMIDAAPIPYGGACLNALIGAGVPAGDIISAGTKLMLHFADLLPQESEVQAAENFTETEPGANLSA